MQRRKNEHQFTEVFSAEKERIGAHRETRKDTSDRLVGLAISGGGIRSASFGMGVLQALNKNGLLKCLDYISTVSGGGYIGSSLTWFNHQQAGVNWKFPFGTRGTGSRSGPDSDVLSFIRQHGNYLTPGNNLSIMSFFATILRNMLMSGAVYFALLVVILFFLISNSFVSPPPIDEGRKALSLASTSLQWAKYMTVLFALITVAHGIGTFLATGSTTADYRLRVMVEKILGWTVMAGIILALIASLPYAFAALKGGTGTLAAGTAATAAGAGGGIYEFLKQRAPSAVTKAPSNIRILLTALALIYGLLLLAYYVAGIHMYLAGRNWPDVINFVLLPALILGFFINLNFFGIGRTYRDRLMETFLPDASSVKSGKWNLALRSNRKKLSEMCGSDEYGPYHLVNCNAVLVDSDVAKYRGRGGDNFILSPLFCGSDATYWYPTTQFLNDRMTLSTAMAISGAAANPNSGVGGHGPTRNRLISFLMAFLSVRLGYWARNPFASGLRRLLAAASQPNLLNPGIVQGLLGQRLNAYAGYLELSDGGHFENTGLYELARRKLDLIIVSDAGADPDFSMADLGNAIERIRVDFGYYIRFADAQYNLREVMPGSSGSSSFEIEYGIATRGFALGTIEYGASHEGIIVFVKTTMIRDMPEDVYAYRKAHGNFPDESTADQFFDEVQLESYRELGYQIVNQMMEDQTAAGRIRNAAGI